MNGDRGTSEEARDPSTAARPPGVPRWVKVCAVVTGAVLVLLLVLMLAGVGGEHGPGRHMGAGGARAGAVARDVESMGVDGLWR